MMAKAGLLAALNALALLAACAPKPAPRPAPPPLPARPAPAPVPAQSPPPLDWRDMALTAGAWRYGAEDAIVLARFAAADGSGFVLGCDLARRRIVLTREAAGAAGAMTIRTSSGTRGFATPSATIPASDPFLDALAFSRGRFTVEVAGLPSLVLPAWPEPARVVEDCRG